MERPRNLPENEVHVWSIPLDRDAAALEVYARVLSADERQRLSQFYLEEQPRRFTVARGSLRLILASYLDAAPQEIEFAHSAQGKPGLSVPHAAAGVCFNLSHSHELALLGVVRRHDIGVDLEYIPAQRDRDAIAARFFASGEQAAYFGLPEAQKPLAFASCWTRKEAFIKALGQGLSYPLSQFEVSLLPGDPPRLLRVGDDPGEARRWTLESFDPEPGYIAAVSLRARDIRFHRLSFSEGEFL